jgi:glycosyltransferase involved in cell wall biosynthesis
MSRKKNIEIRRLIKLVKLLKIIKPDIIHTYLSSANSYGRIAAFLTRVPVIIASERNFPEVGKDKSLFQIYIDKILASFSHGIICNSTKASEILINKYSFDGRKIFTVYNGIRSADFAEKPEAAKKRVIARKVIGFVGRLEPQKNHKLFLDIAKIILSLSYNDDIKFLIIGKGSLQKELQIYARTLGIESKVFFTGHRHDVQELMHDMDIFMMTSLYEGMSNAIMEAMLAGLPVVASDVGGNSELVVHGETGFICPLNDAEAFAEKVLFFLQNGKQAVEMGEKGKKRMISEFGIEKMVKETESIYKSLAKQYQIDSNVHQNLQGLQ